MDISDIFIPGVHVTKKKKLLISEFTIVKSECPKRDIFMVPFANNFCFCPF